MTTEELSKGRHAEAEQEPDATTERDPRRLIDPTWPEATIHLREVEIATSWQFEPSLPNRRFQAPMIIAPANPTRTTARRRDAQFEFDVLFDHTPVFTLA